MSPKLPSLKSREVIRVLEKKGWTVARTRGSHHVLVHPGSRRPITVPVHAKDLKTGTLNGILNEADISRDELRDLL